MISSTYQQARFLKVIIETSNYPSEGKNDDFNVQYFIKENWKLTIPLQTDNVANPACSVSDMSSKIWSYNQDKK